MFPFNSNGKSKKEQVALMFDNISLHYDFLNHFLSLGFDKIWRKKAIGILIDFKPKKILDVATGTADLAIEAARLKPESITGIDISPEMLKICRNKIGRKGLSNLILLQEGDSENICFPDFSFDAVTAAFGVRNFGNLEKGLKEMHSVLRAGGLVVILEFSRPSAFPFAQVYNFYFRFIMPLIGSIISKDASAYTYLPESVSDFAEGKDFIQKLEEAGFIRTNCRRLSFGIASVYSGMK